MTTNDDISQAISALIDRLNAAEDKLNVNPIAFNWTPAMSAIWPDGMRPTMSGLLAVWEAMHEAAVYDDMPEPFPGAKDGWIPHKAGDPMPCDSDLKVEYKMRRGEKPAGPSYAGKLNWSNCGPLERGNWVITHWRPAQ
jgi:hypothetical protein